MADEEYRVGYGKPPERSQFRKGQSGNPKGRPKGTKNLRTDLQEELRQSITITEGGKSMKVSKQRGLLMSILARALRGDSRSASLVLGLHDRLLGDDATDGQAKLSPSAEEEEVLAAVRKRLGTRAADVPGAGETSAPSRPTDVSEYE